MTKHNNGNSHTQSKSGIQVFQHNTISFQLKHKLAPHKRKEEHTISLLNNSYTVKADQTVICSMPCSSCATSSAARLNLHIHLRCNQDNLHFSIRKNLPHMETQHLTQITELVNNNRNLKQKALKHEQILLEPLAFTYKRTY